MHSGDRHLNREKLSENERICSEIVELEARLAVVAERLRARHSPADGALPARDLGGLAPAWWRSRMLEWIGAERAAGNASEVLAGLELALIEFRDERIERFVGELLHLAGEIAPAA